MRPFRPGDRLRRINWAVSSRTGALHVTSTWSDRDTQVLLLLDTEYDIGESEGIDGAGEQPRHRRAGGGGDRRALPARRRPGQVIDLGRRVRDVRPGSGRRHLRRVLEVLVAAEAGAEPPRRAGAHPAADRRGARRRAVAARRPPRARPRSPTSCSTATPWSSSTRCPTTPSARQSPWRALATRLRALERPAEIDRLGELGVPVVPWRGRGHARRGAARRQPAGTGTEAAMTTDAAVATSGRRSDGSAACRSCCAASSAVMARVADRRHDRAGVGRARTGTSRSPCSPPSATCVAPDSASGVVFVGAAGA